MAKKALLVMLHAKPGKEESVEMFLKQGAAMSHDEPGTIDWFGLKLSHGVYAVFDTFEDEAGREAHLNGEIAAALASNADALLLEPFEIQKLEIIANK